MPTDNQPALDDETRQFAHYIAAVIRNGIEDFHCQHLSDDQMKELNPLVRNAVATALHAFNHYERASAARRYVDYYFKAIPAYWEPAELQAGYRQMWQRDQAKPQDQHDS